MPEESMTPRERWEAVLGRKKPDRVPMDYWATDETTFMLMEHLGCSTKRGMLKKLKVDYLVKARPRYVGPKIPRGFDVFGRRYAPKAYGSGYYRECVFNPLAGFTSIGDIEKNYTWPDPDWWDYSRMADRLPEWETHPVQAGHYEPFLIYKDLRGDVQAFIDLVEYPELVHYCMDHLFRLGYEEYERSFEALRHRKVTLSYIAEDLGGQEDLMLSPDHIHEFIISRMQPIIDLVHQAGARVFHHNDGSVRRILPDMIELGIDILNPIQWRCKNMDREGLKRDFGDRVILHGGVDNQITLPFGSVEDVRQEVLDNFRILGRDGGYILAPCHNIQPLTPVENIIALYETGYEHGWT